MVRVVLKGVHKTRKWLADGSVREYYYAWKTGPKLDGKPGSPEFIASYNVALASRKAERGDVIGSIVHRYLETDFLKKKPATRRGYWAYLKEIEKEFGLFPLPVTDRDYKLLRQVFLNWRDTKADRPRTADYAWSVLKLLMEFGVDRSMITKNPCARGGRLWKGSRQGKVWTNDLFTTLLANASYEVGLVCRMALETGQRQNDILNMKWASFDGERFRFPQEKRGHNVSVLLTKQLAEEIRKLQRKNEVDNVQPLFVCLNSRGTPWTSSGFRASFNKSIKQAAVLGLTFHDLRGTAITRAYSNQIEKDLSAIATRFGLSMVSVNALLDRHYLAPDQDKADEIVRRMETQTRTKLQTVSKPCDSKS